MRLLLQDTRYEPPHHQWGEAPSVVDSVYKRGPFRHINGTMYRQVDGVAMGSALGVTFANYYMAHIENTVISDLTVKPKLYARYVDDCFLVVEDEQHLELIRREFQNKSVLKFTKEISINNRLNFLDVAIDSNGESLRHVRV